MPNYCRKCGKPLGSANRCSNCGWSVSSAAAPMEKKKGKKKRIFVLIAVPVLLAGIALICLGLILPAMSGKEKALRKEPSA